MKNIVIFGLDLEDTIIFAKHISKKLNIKHINANLLFDKTLLNSINNPILLADVELDEKESELCAKLSNKNDIVVSISDDMFLSNENYKHFKNSINILVLSKTKSKFNSNSGLNCCTTRQNIEKLLQAHAKFTIDNSNLDEIIENLKKC